MSDDRLRPLWDGLDLEATEQLAGDEPVAQETRVEKLAAARADIRRGSSGGA